MARRRTIKTVNSDDFIQDISTISKLLNKHLDYLRTDVPHYKAIAALNHQVVETGRQLYDGKMLPWAWGSTGPAKS